jgi:rhamnosyltransferase
MNSRGTVLAIVVTYFPDQEGLQHLLGALSPQVTELLVVDNTPGEENVTWDTVRSLGSSLANIRMVRLGENLGIATALNVGIECALAEGFDFALLSDQDSLPEPDMVVTLKNVAQERLASGVRVASVCPEYFDQTTGVAGLFQVQLPGRLFYSRAAGDHAKPWLEIVTSITSGCLLTRDAMLHVGGMCNDLFIDHVDTEWSHRARSLGFVNYGTAETRLTHRLGDDVFSVWYFGWHPYSDYSPLRLYYRFRNFVLLWRFPHVPKRWALRASWYWLGSFYAHGLFAAARLANLQMMLRGIWDGILGRTGKFESR